MDVSCVWEAGALLGEGGLWDAERRCLWWVDIKRSQLNRYDPAPERCTSLALDTRVTALGMTAGRRLVASTDLGFATIDPDTGTIAPIVHPEAHIPGNRFNDGKVAPDGAFWAGTMDDAEEERRGSVYRLGADGAVQRIAGEFHVPNGPAFDPRSGWIYLSDTAQRRTERLRLDAGGAVTAREPFATFDEAQGYPDGMTVDEDGHVWIAFWDGGCVRRLSPDGRIVAELRLPVGRPTSCTFGGDRLDTLFVTSARTGLDEAALRDQPLAGGLFRIGNVGARGVPAPRFVA